MNTRIRFRPRAPPPVNFVAWFSRTGPPLGEIDEAHFVRGFDSGPGHQIPALPVLEGPFLWALARKNAETQILAAMTSSSTPLHQLDAWQAAALLARRELQAVDLVRAYLDRIAEREPQLQAFV